MTDQLWGLGLCFRPVSSSIDVDISEMSTAEMWRLDHDTLEIGVAEAIEIGGLSK